jgi:hypothetical protein
VRLRALAAAAVLAAATILLTAAGVAAPTSASAAAARPGARARVVTVRVRPAVAGVPVVLHGHRHRTDAAGAVHVRAGPRELAHRGILLRDRLRVPTTRLGRALQVRLSRWVGRTASIVLLRPVRLHLVNARGIAIDPSVAPRVGIRGTDGSRIDVPTGRVVWLPAVRAIVRPGGRWRSRGVSFAVQQVDAYGANAVNRAQQRFQPERARNVAVRVLFFAARVRSRDALFGTPSGDAVVLRFPDGHTKRLALGAAGERRLGGLPRGDYLLSVAGPGLSFARPVALSRSQDVTLQVITWLDLALSATAVLLGLFALELLRRGLIRRARRARPLGGPVRRHG